ncbi:phenylacetate-CoA oxygenase, PaaJ subunit [Streptomyces sp. SolWspMP-sol7th]|nr:phenylacetate-CoA oxygenase, PaaJ subunit [Streptomyces sp. SolWspMP-sol7th]
MVSAAAPVSDPRLRAAWEAAGRVPDPELPMLSLHDLGVLRDLAYEEDGTLVVSLTPTYSGCPAMAEMRAATVRALNGAGFGAVRVRTVLDPPWTTDWMTEEGRAALAAHHIVPPRPASGPRRGGPVPLSPLPHPSRGRRGGGALPAVRRGRRRGAVALLRDLLPLPAPLSRVRGTLRAVQGDLRGRTGRGPAPLSRPPPSRGPPPPGVVVGG